MLFITQSSSHLMQKLLKNLKSYLVIPSCHWKLRRRCLGRKFIPSNCNKWIPGWINTLDWICLEWIIQGNRKIKVDDNDYIHIKIKWCVLLGPNSQETGIRLWSLMNLLKNLFLINAIFESIKNENKLFEHLLFQSTPTYFRSWINGTK